MMLKPLFKARIPLAARGVLRCTPSRLSSFCSFMAASHKGDRRSQPLPPLQHSDHLQEPVPFHLSSLAESPLLCEPCLQHFRSRAVGAREPKSSRSGESVSHFRNERDETKAGFDKHIENTLV